jgi:hypothetical protein
MSAEPQLTAFDDPRRTMVAFARAIGMARGHQAIRSVLAQFVVATLDARR